MALKDLMLRKQLEEKQKALEELRSKDFETREAELEGMIEEAATEEEKAAVEEAVNEFDAEKADTEEKAAALEQEIASLEAELEERSKKALETAQKAEKPKELPEEKEEVRKEDHYMLHRNIKDMTMEERSALMAREDVKQFVADVKARMTRDITNGTIVIPTVIAGMITAIAEESSKLLKHVRVEAVPGVSRLIVDGGFPEAVWTEQCGKLNDLTLGLYDLEVDGYKVGGVIKVCNALLEDSDIDLVAYIAEKLGRAIGYALDKAIVFGTGVKMPLGFATRLLQAEAPADVRSTALPWVNLNTTNVTKLSATASKGTELIKGIVAAAGAINNKYGDGKFWVMNEKTKAAVIGETLAVNAAGAIVAGVGSDMPVVGGTIETLDFVPDNMIFGGAEGCYYLAERAGASITSSDHAFFVEDQTAFKGTARYDGAPAIPDAFIAVGINNTTVAATGVTFAADTANA